eukprot:TRINITY_DN611_c2_g1_i1.p1 TRINITY_DN611_c2_g1~~TRINITY_DN611_c2_g1_i1.p1  ORF type:complete len:133 (+),score=45.54 TRINITY_DN611_c2_g1_i1:62-460(+)
MSNNNNGQEYIQTDENPGFVIDSVAEIVKKVVDTHLRYETYEQQKVPGLCQNILTSTMQDLHNLNPNYKYIVNCTILQKGEASAGLHTQSSCLWDTTTDGSYTLRWENRYLHCILTVFGIVNTEIFTVTVDE